MSPLRTIARDLIDRRLWPLAALLAVGLVAIPVVFLRPAPNAVSEAPAPPAATAPPANPAAATTPAAPSDPTADASASSAAAAPVSTPAPVAGPSAPEQVPTTPSTPSKPATPAEPTPAADDWRVFRADVSFGNTETLPVDSDAARLTAYPTVFNPIAIYLGVMRGGWGAVFMLRDDVRPVGAPSCRPRKSICTWVILHSGESVTLNAKDATGAVTPYTLKLAAVREDTVSEDAAKEAYGRASAGGRCLLGPLAAYHYDADTGTLALRPEMKACRYQGDTGADTPITTADGATDSGATAG
jgi:hypothetical protein